MRHFLVYLFEFKILKGAFRIFSEGWHHFLDNDRKLAWLCFTVECMKTLHLKFATCIEFSAYPSSRRSSMAGLTGSVKCGDVR